MSKLKELLKYYLLALGAGMCIGIGGAVFLTLAPVNKIAGAFFFSVGLTAILVFGLSLFTGMVGYMTDHGPGYLLSLLAVWLGNLTGTVAFALFLRATRVGDALIATCTPIVNTKLEDAWYSLLILGVFCGILMYVAVDTFKNRSENRPVLGVFAVIMGVTVFILAGFEHSIADMFYFALCSSFPRAFLPLLWITLGNLVGGNLIPVIRKGSDVLK